jgi:hypothetical protein
MKASVAVVVATAMLGCGGAKDASTQTKVPVALAPDRTAVEDNGVRQLLRDVAVQNLCDATAGTLIGLHRPDAPIGPERGSEPVIGRQWVEHCDAVKKDDDLEVHLHGRGWSWVENTSKKLGAKFEIAQYVPFEADIKFQATVDMSYVREKHVLSFWLTPDRPVKAKIVATREPDVDRKGPWAEILGGVSAIAGSPPNKQAAKKVQEQGSEQTRRGLRRGYTVTLDLCSGQRDIIDTALYAGVLPSRPAGPPATLWKMNERVRLMPGGLDAVGTFEMNGKPLAASITVDSGAGVRASLVCKEEADRVITAFLRGEPAPEVATLADVVVDLAAPQMLKVEPSCKALFIVRPAEGAKSPVEYHYSLFDPGRDPKAIAPCG